jgi:ketosteroid isomerase-like protein/phenylpyruvate tautomerase PptA (4-oxalocrotonate tautomerase family)
VPVIRTTVIKGFTDRALQEEISRGLSDALLNIMGEVSRPWIYSIVEEVNPGSWYFSSFGDVMPDESTVASGRTQIEEHRRTRLTAARVLAAYAALASGDAEEINRYFDEEMVWTFPGNNQISGTKKGRGEFLANMARIGELSANSFNMENKGVFTGGDPAVIGGDTSVDLSHNTGHRAGDESHLLDIDVVHVVRWRQGRIIEGRGAIFGNGTAEFDAFWS